MHNLDVKTDLKKTIKKFLTAVESKNKTEAQTDIKVLYKKLDKAAKINAIHKNTASRRKSRFGRLLTTLK
jgi:small subunit ribosomal protein S20